MGPKAADKLPLSSGAPHAEAAPPAEADPAAASKEENTTPAGKYPVADPGIQKKIEKLWAGNPHFGTAEHTAAHVQSKALQYRWGTAGLKANTTIEVVNAVEKVKEIFDKKFEGTQGKEAQQQAMSLVNMKASTNTGHPYRLYGDNMNPRRGSCGMPSNVRLYYRRTRVR